MAEDQRDARRRIIKLGVVAIGAVFAQGFAVRPGHDDQGVGQLAARPQQIEQRADLFVDEGDFPVVRVAARALGETAPLLLIGMVAFVADYPSSPLDPSTALPVQIYMWAGEAERAFVERTSAAIIVLLVFLILMNLTAVILRRRFERRW